MNVVTLTESESASVALTPEQASALRAVGRRLASSKVWWGAADAKSADRSVIVVEPRDDGQWAVRVSDAVGFVTVPGLQLQVQPKISPTHLLYLLANAGAIPRIDTERLFLASGTSLLELLAQWYVSATEQVLRADLLKDYVSVREPLSVVRGALHVVPTARSFLSGRLAIDCSYQDFLTDTPLNRLLKAAARSVEALDGVSRPVRRRARALADRMDGVGVIRTTDLSATVDRRSAFYTDAIELAHLVLHGTALDWRTDERAGRAFLIRTPEMVEAGLRAILEAEFGPQNVVKRPIVIAPSRMTLNPDILAPSVNGVGDIKYKLTAPEWARADLYQVVAFAHASRAKKAVVSTFSAPGISNLPELVIGGTPITHIAWDAHPDLNPEAARVRWVSAFDAWFRAESAR